MLDLDDTPIESGNIVDLFIDEEPDVKSSSKKKPKEPKAPKEPKPKKRMSDFEIMRTILQRTNERKLPFWLRNMGVDDNIVILCSQTESDFTYGSPTTALAFIEFTDPDLKTMADSLFSNFLGYDEEQPMVINIRDQISEFGKSKGEIQVIPDVISDGHGAHWVDKADVTGNIRTLVYSKPVNSLFHYQTVAFWWDLYKSVLQDENPDYLYHPHVHGDSNTYSIVSFAPPEDKTHPITTLYPHGFRIGLTKGLDVLMSKGCETLPYPIVKQELIAFLADGSTAQTAHRITGEGWRMLVVRPNAYVFPALTAPIINTGEHVL